MLFLGFISGLRLMWLRSVTMRRVRVLTFRLGLVLVRLLKFSLVGRRRRMMRTVEGWWDKHKALKVKLLKQARKSLTLRASQAGFTSGQLDSINSDSPS